MKVKKSAIHLILITATVVLYQIKESASISTTVSPVKVCKIGGANCLCPQNVKEQQLLCGNEISGNNDDCKPEAIYICEEGSPIACIHEELGDCAVNQQYCDLARNIDTYNYDYLVNQKITLSSENKTSLVNKRKCYPSKNQHINAWPHPRPRPTNLRRPNPIIEPYPRTIVK